VREFPDTYCLRAPVVRKAVQKLNFQRPSLPAQRIKNPIGFRSELYVVITGGTFETFKGTVTGTDGMQLIVRIDIFGRPVEIPVSAIDLKKIPARE
jgi:transcription antitermination factor NusG